MKTMFSKILFAIILMAGIFFKPAVAQDEKLELDESTSELLKHISNLPEEQRTVVMLRHYYEMPFKEIAELTDVSINTALGRMRYALINLRKMFDEELEKQPNSV